MKGVTPERAWLSLLNSIEVRRDLVRWRERPRPLVLRLLDDAFGQSRKIDHLFDRHDASSFEDLVTVVSTLRDTQTENTLVLSSAVRRLHAVRLLVDEHGGRLDAIRREIDSLAVTFQETILALEGRVTVLEGISGIDDLIVHLRLAAHTRELNLADLWQALDDLYWSRFGAVLRRPAEDRDRIEAVQRLRDRLAASGLLPRTLEISPLLDRVPLLADDDREDIEFVALSPTWNRRPLTTATLLRSVKTPDLEHESRHVPVVVSLERLTDKLLEESRRGTEE